MRETVEMNEGLRMKIWLQAMLRRMFVLLVVCMSVGIITPASASDSPSVDVLFIGNSFTAAMHSAAWHYRASTVHDLDGTGVGGVPALFELFTKEAGLNYSVSVEALPGKTLKYHFLHKRSTLDHPWDEVVMQEYSVLSRTDPGNPKTFNEYAIRLAKLFTAKNKNVRVWLLGTWSRPDLTYKRPSPWFNKSIDAMADDLQSACDRVAASSLQIAGVVPVGLAFNLAVSEHVADGDPYDGVKYGEVNLWAYDNHHASIYGYYLEALMDFGVLTGRDPRTLGEAEQGAIELGLDPSKAAALQGIAYQQLQRRSSQQPPVGKNQ